VFEAHPGPAPQETRHKDLPHRPHRFRPDRHDGRRPHRQGRQRQHLLLARSGRPSVREPGPDVRNGQRAARSVITESMVPGSSASAGLFFVGLKDSRKTARTLADREVLHARSQQRRLTSRRSEPTQGMQGRSAMKTLFTLVLFLDLIALSGAPQVFLMKPSRIPGFSSLSHLCLTTRPSRSPDSILGRGIILASEAGKAGFGPRTGPGLA
jgi:hypothetical protein